MAMAKIFEAVEAKRAEAPLVTQISKPGKRETKSTFSESEVSDVSFSVRAALCTGSSFVDQSPEFFVAWVRR